MILFRTALCYTERKKSFVLTIGGMAEDDTWKRVTASNGKVKLNNLGNNRIKITAKKKKGKVKLTVLLYSGKTATCTVTIK